MLSRGRRRLLAWVAPVTILALAGSLVWGFLFFDAWGNARTLSVDFDEPDRVTSFTAAAGDRWRFQLHGMSFCGMFASSTGLRLDVEGQGVQVLPPKKKDWGDTTHYCRGHKDVFEVDWFRVPDATTSTLAGNVTGTILIPILRGGGFVNQQRELDLPVSLHLVTADEADAIRGEAVSTPRTGFFAGGALFLVSFPVVAAASAPWWRDRLS